MHFGFCQVITVINKAEHLSKAADVSHTNYKIAYKTDRECHCGVEIANFRDLIWATEFHNNFRALIQPPGC